MHFKQRKLAQQTRLVLLGSERAPQACLEASTVPRLLFCICSLGNETAGTAYTECCRHLRTKSSSRVACEKWLPAVNVQCPIWILLLCFPAFQITHESTPSAVRALHILTFSFFFPSRMERSCPEQGMQDHHRCLLEIPQGQHWPYSFSVRHNYDFPCQTAPDKDKAHKQRGFMTRR